MKGTREACLEFEAIDGNVDLRERGEHGEGCGGGYANTVLVDADYDEVTVAISHYKHPDCPHRGPKLEVSAYHVGNPETGRHFHANLQAYLDWQQIEQLRDFLSYMLTLRG